MDWRHHAACREEDPELFFPIGNTGPALLQIEEAKAVCRRCPVMEQCLQWALESGQDSGRLGWSERGRAPRPQAPCRPRPTRRPPPDGPLSPELGGAARQYASPAPSRSAQYSPMRSRPTHGNAPLAPGRLQVRVLLCPAEEAPRRGNGIGRGVRPLLARHYREVQDHHGCRRSGPGDHVEGCRPTLCSTRVRTICRPRLPAVCGSKPSGRPTPSSWTVTRGRPPRSWCRGPRMISTVPVSPSRKRRVPGRSAGSRSGTIDGGVAISASRLPKRPVPPAVTLPGEISATIASTAVGDLVELHAARPGSGTASHARWRSTRPGALPPPAPRGPGGPSTMRLACTAQQGVRRVWRLFFTRWWISRMVASLVINSRSRRRSSVTSRQEHQRTDAGALGSSGMARELDDAVGRLDLELARRPAAGDLGRAPRPPGRGTGRVRRWSCRGGAADQVGGEAEPVVGGQRVGGGVLDDAVGVQADQAVADPRRGVHVDLLVREREGTGRDHLREVDALCR